MKLSYSPQNIIHLHRLSPIWPGLAARHSTPSRGTRGTRGTESVWPLINTAAPIEIEILLNWKMVSNMSHPQVEIFFELRQFTLNILLYMLNIIREIHSVWHNTMTARRDWGWMTSGYRDMNDFLPQNQNISHGDGLHSSPVDCLG